MRVDPGRAARTSDESAPLTAALAGRLRRISPHKHGGGLYTGKCAKHDKKLTWNTTGPAGPAGATGKTGATGATGPQGPGARALVFNGAGTPAPTATSLGTAGPYGLSAECIEPAVPRTTTTTRLLEVGPAATLDGLQMVGTAGRALSLAYPAHPSWRSWSPASVPQRRR